MIRTLKNYIKNFIYKKVSDSTELTHRLLNEKRELILNELYKYPSFINNGYLHFEKLFEIARNYKLTDQHGIILDVGGADGVTAVKFSKEFTKARVYVFEPLKSNLEVLKKNIEPYKNITLFPIALGSEKKHTTINVTHRITSSSLLQVNTGEFKDDYISSQLAPESKEEIMLDTIDNLVNENEKVLVLKMDVQGFELEVLKGAKKTLKNTMLVMAEFQNHKLYSGAPMYYDIDKYLIDNGFTLLMYIPSLIQNHKQLEWDAIYINNSLI